MKRNTEQCVTMKSQKNRKIGTFLSFFIENKMKKEYYSKALAVIWEIAGTLRPVYYV